MVFQASHKWIRTYKETRTSHDIISKWIQFAFAIERLSRRLSFLRRKICAKHQLTSSAKHLSKHHENSLTAKFLTLINQQNSATFIDCCFQLSLTSLNPSNLVIFALCSKALKSFFSFKIVFQSPRNCLKLILRARSHKWNWKEKSYFRANRKREEKRSRE